MLDQAKRWLDQARSVAVLTGAGISAESGIPTFRSAGGLWKQFRPEELATPQAFARDPLLVWEWYQWRRALISRAEPNAGHLALAALERRKEIFTLITQNVDGLHDRAGSKQILKIHGDIWTLRCTACPKEWRDLRPVFPALPPKCECGAMARPGVVWFGESLPARVWEEAERAAASAEVFLVAGTSAVVYPAAGLVPLAKSAGAKVIELNTEETPASAIADAALRGRSAEILPMLISSE